jgi:hypothetical protein
MEENKFWLRICGMGTLILVCMIGSCTFGMHDRRDKWEKAVSNGADPMVVACALFDQTEAERATCALLAQNRK